MLTWRQINRQESSTREKSNAKVKVHWLLVLTFFVISACCLFLLYIVPFGGLRPSQSKIFYHIAVTLLPVLVFVLLAIRFRLLSLRTIQWLLYGIIYAGGTYGYLHLGGPVGPMSSFYLTFLCLTFVFLSGRITIFFGFLSFLPLVAALVFDQFRPGNLYLADGQSYSEYLILSILFLSAAILTVTLATKNITRVANKNLQLTKRLRIQNLELANQKSEIEQRVLERTNELAKANTILQEQTIELLHAKNKAEESDRMKSNFLANMSHEIRTPLTSIIGTADLLVEETDGESKELVEMIYKGGNRLMNTLNSVLDLAQLEGSSMRLNQCNLDMLEETEAVVALLKNMADKKGLTLSVKSEGEGSFIANLDRAAFDRILQNLIGNALKFTERGRVDVTVSSQGESVRVLVKDTGIGISEGYLPKIFDQFSQESSGEGRSFEGNGLGLALTKGLVSMMNGSITVESEMGKGSSFSVEFPKAEIHGECLELARKRKEVVTV